MPITLTSEQAALVAGFISGAYFNGSERARKYMLKSDPETLAALLYTVGELQTATEAEACASDDPIMHNNIVAFDLAYNLGAA